MLAFGVPQRFTGAAALALPVVELAAAVALVVRPSAQWGGLVALALLVAFIGGITNVLVHGRTPDCNCFGQIATAPVTWRTLVRNGVLAALAVIVLAQGAGSSLLGWTGSRSASELIAILIFLAMIAGVVVGLRLRRENRSLQASVDQMRRE